jgi:hypothetical protein
MITERTMRWFERRCRYVGNTELIDPKRYSIDCIDNERAARFIARHHYLPTMPAAQLCVALFGPRNGANQSPVTGIAIFAVPSNPSVIPAHAGLPPANGTTLARFILLDDVPANGETHFLSRAHSALRREKPHLEAVVSYADPVAGHIGHIYAAASAAHRGRTRPRTSWSIAGRTIPGRTLSKIANEESGADAAIARLTDLGARTPSTGENAAQWLQSLKRTAALRPTSHPGYYVYNFPLTARARSRSRALPTQPYPTIADLAANSGAPTS